MPRVTSPFSFGIQTGPFLDHDALVEHARRVEDLGYLDLFSYDHLGAVDPFVPLTVAADATTTLRLGPLVINNEFHHPALLARTAATFDALSGGRLVLGLGTGYMQSEHDATGIRLRPPGERVDRFIESFRVLRTLLDDGRCSFHGDHHEIEIEDLGVRPAQPSVPLLVGGHGRRMVDFAARHADVFQYTGLTHDPGTGAPSAGGFDMLALQQRKRWIDGALDGRDADRALTVSALVQVTHVGDGAARALDEAAERIGLPHSEVEATPFVLIGSRTQIVEKLHRLRDELGIHHYVVRDPEAFAPVVAELAGRT